MGSAPPLNIAHDPWLECHTPDGVTVEVGLLDALDRADELSLAVTDPLLEAAVVRLFAALCYGADGGPEGLDEYVANIHDGGHTLAATTRSFVAAHVEQCALTGAEPFGQDRSLRNLLDLDAESVQPAICLDVTAALDRPLLSDERSLAEAIPLSPVAAVRSLLVMQTWCLGGRLRLKTTDFRDDPKASFGKSSPLNGRIAMVPRAGTLGELLAWRVVPAPAGTMQWNYAPRAGEPFSGEAEALSLLPRRILLGTDERGDIDRVVMAQGQHYQDHDPAAPQPGWADLLMTSTTGKALSGAALPAEHDPVPVLAHTVARTPHRGHPGSLLDYARHTQEQIPDFAAISLVPQARGQKKPNMPRRVIVPHRVLSDPEAASTAISRVMAVRRRLPTAGPLATGALGLSDVAAGNMDMQQWRETTGAHGVQTLVAQAPQDPATVRAIAEVADPVSSPATNEADVMSAAQTSDDDDYDVTDDAADLDDAIRPDQDPARALMRRLASYVDTSRLTGTTNQRRGTVAQLRQRPQALDLSDPAVLTVTRDMPVDRVEPAAMVATLFAVWHQRYRRPRFGRTPLPRLARSFGNSSGFGPDHPPTSRDMRQVVNTSRQKLMPSLLRLVRFASSQDKDINWWSLFEDLWQWNEGPQPIVRTKWTMLFRTQRSISEINTLLLMEGQRR